MLPCHIVKDLLPSYVDGLTSRETARAVEDHLEGCPDCRAVRDAMTARLELDHAPQPHRDFLGEFKRHQHITVLLLVALTFVLTYVLILTLNRLVEVNALHSLGLFLLIPLVCGTLIAWAFRRKRRRTLLVLCHTLGLLEGEEEEAGEDVEKIEALIAERAAAKKAKDFARADAIRDELAAMGITIKDTRQGTQWSRA